MTQLDDLVCGRCGLRVSEGPSRSGDRVWYHVADEPPDNWEDHEAENVKTRREYLFGKEKERVQTPVDHMRRQADALEDIASSLQKIVQYIYRT